MSLWHKQIEGITFDDIDAFCALQIPEGIRLDYKLAVPGDLAKVVAAFANTLGGLIILGVEADKAKNLPVWPPTKGMEISNGLEERITAICRDNIYPPVRPQISPVIDNQQVPGNVIVVVRIVESPEAPHAINGFIYERTGSQGTRCEYSKIDRIGNLLERRGQIAGQRLEMTKADLERAGRQLTKIRVELGEEAGLVPAPDAIGNRRGLPLFWASVIPVYPWRDLCTPQTCYDSLNLFHHDGPPLTRQKVPGGAFAKLRLGRGLTDESVEAACFSLSSKGHVFGMECVMGVLARAHMACDARREPSPIPVLDLEHMEQFATRLFDSASRFYKQPNVEMPGHLLLSIGLIDVYGAMMSQGNGTRNASRGQSFLDDDFGADVQVPLDQFLASPSEAFASLFDDLRFGFDL